MKEGGGVDEVLLREMLDDALAGEPPIGPLAATAERAGTIVRRRRAWAAAGSAAAVAAIAAALLVPGLAGTRQPQPGATPGRHQHQGRAEMPQVLGLRLAAAEARIRRVITAPVFAVRRVEAPLPAGKVIAQLPGIGIKAGPHARVLLTLSAGNRPPRCPARAGTASAVVRIRTQPTPPYFGRSCYYARAGQPITIIVTNHVHDLGDRKPITDVIVISRASRPVITAIPGQRGMSSGDFSRAVYVSPKVPAGPARAFTTGPLAAGRYVMQIEACGLESTVTLTIS